MQVIALKVAFVLFIFQNVAAVNNNQIDNRNQLKDTLGFLSKILDGNGGNIEEILNNLFNGTNGLQDILNKSINGISSFEQMMKGFMNNTSINELMKDMSWLKALNGSNLAFIESLKNLDTNAMKKLLSGNFDAMDMIKMMLKMNSKGFPNVSPGCKASFDELIGNKSITPLNLITSKLGKMLDAWGKPGARILIGNLNWVGAFDECENIENLKYCKSLYTFALKFPGKYGTCVPKTCSPQDVDILLKTLQGYLQNVITFKDGKTICTAPVKYSAGSKITIAILIVLVILVFIGTITDLLQDAFTPSIEFVPKLKHPIADIEGREDNYGLANEENISLRSIPKVQMTRGNTFTNILICFSFVKNTEALLSTKVPKGAIGCINGIRFISMTWVILGHYYFLGFIGGVLDNSVQMAQDLRKFSFLPISNAYVSVDTFFLLSGLLVGYLTLRRIDKNNGMSLKQYGIYVLHRYIRLTPSLGLVMLFYVNIFPLTVSGPFAMEFQQMDAPFQSCLDYWWTNLLYINNFYPTSMGGQCIGWVWYLANDMQFYIISPAILLLFYYFDKKYEVTRFRYVPAFIITLVLCLPSFVASAVLIGVNNYPTLITAFFFPDNPRKEGAADVQDILYEKPYIRIPPYLIGLLLGYIFSRKITFKSHRTKVGNVIGWVLAITVSLAIIYGPWHVYKPEGQTYMTNFENIMYGTFHRWAWSVAIAWVIFSCHNELGGLVNRFLSWRAFIPLSRMTYGAYLMHFIVLTWYYFVQEKSYHLQENLVPFPFLSVVVISYGFAFLLSVFVEGPVGNLEKMIFK